MRIYGKCPSPVVRIWKLYCCVFFVQRGPVLKEGLVRCQGAVDVQHSQHRQDDRFAHRRNQYVAKSASLGPMAYSSMLIFARIGA